MFCKSLHGLFQNKNVFNKCSNTSYMCTDQVIVVVYVFILFIYYYVVCALPLPSFFNDCGAGDLPTIHAYAITAEHLERKHIKHTLLKNTRQVLSVCVNRSSTISGQVLKTAYISGTSLKVKCKLTALYSYWSDLAVASAMVVSEKQTRPPYQMCQAAKCYYHSKNQILLYNPCFGVSAFAARLYYFR